MNDQVQPKVGDRVRLTRVIEGVVVEGPNGRLTVDDYFLDIPGHTVEILPEPLPSEPGTFWMDRDGDVWCVTDNGLIWCLGNRNVQASGYAPFRQLVLK